MFFKSRFFFKSVKSWGKQTGCQDPDRLHLSSMCIAERSHLASDIPSKICHLVWQGESSAKASRTNWSEMNFKKATEELNTVQKYREQWWNSPAVYCSDLELHPPLQPHLLSLIFHHLWYFSGPELGCCWHDLQLYLDCPTSSSFYQYAQLACTYSEREMCCIWR